MSVALQRSWLRGERATIEEDSGIGPTSGPKFVGSDELVGLLLCMLKLRSV